MSLAANEPTVKKIVNAEPLFFRSIEEFVQVSAPVLDQAVAAGPTEAFDFEASLRAAHEQGRREAMAAAEHDMAQRLLQERASVGRFVQQFEQEKQRYFSEVEGEVVKLSLAIAERVLHREAEMDPMLLAGAARVRAGPGGRLQRGCAARFHRRSRSLAPDLRIEEHDH